MCSLKRQSFGSLNRSASPFRMTSNPRARSHFIEFLSRLTPEQQQDLSDRPRAPLRLVGGRRASSPQAVAT